MKTLTIVAKDLRRVRWHLALWWLVVLAKEALGTNEIFGHPIPLDPLGEAVAALTVAELVLGYLIVALVVQEDGVAASRAFWMTRPISRGRLFTAKVIGVAIVGVMLPLLAYAPWWAVFQLGGSDLAAAMRDVAVVRLAVVLPAVMMAALTDTFSRLVVWTLVLAVALVCGPVLWGQLAVFDLLNGGPRFARGVALLVFLEATAVAVIAVQYGRRRLATSVGVVVGGILISGLAGIYGAIVLWPELHGWRGEENPQLGREISLRVTGGHLVQYGTAREPEGFAADFAVSGIPPGLVVAAAGGTQELRCSNGRTWKAATGLKILGTRRQEERVVFGGLSPRDAETARWRVGELNRYRAKRNLPLLPEATAVSPDARAAVRIPKDFAAGIAQQELDYRLVANLQLLAVRRCLDMPVRADTTGRGGGSAVRLLRVEDWTPRGKSAAAAGPWSHVLQISAVVAQPTRWERRIGSWSLRAAEAHSVYLRDESMATTVAAEPLEQRPVGRVSIAGIRFDAMNVKAWQPQLRRGDRWVPQDPQLLEHLSLTIAREREVGRITRVVEASRLPVDQVESADIDYTYAWW